MYDCVDKPTILEILQEFGLDQKAQSLHNLAIKPYVTLHIISEV